MADIANGVPGIKIKEQLQIHSRRMVITSAQVLALSGTPKQIVPAQGADTMIEFVSATVYKPAGTAYAGVAAGEDIAIKYTNASGAQVNTSLETTGFLDQATEQLRLTRAIVTEYTPVVNAPLVIQILTGEIITGTSPLVVTVHYRVYKNVKTQVNG